MCQSPRVQVSPRVRVVWSRVCRRACFPARRVYKGHRRGRKPRVRQKRHMCEPPCVVETPRVSAPAGVCVYEVRVSERPCVGCVRTACVRSLYTREISVAMREHAAVSPDVSMNVNGMMCSVSLAAHRSISVRSEWRLRLRLWRDKCRVAAVVAIGTGPGLHGSHRVVRVVPRTRPPRARLRGLRPGPETHAVD